MNKALKLSNDISMPTIGFGTYELKPDETASKTIRTAIDIGYRMIDTAKLYANERGVGEAIRACGIPRDDLFVTTKLWNTDHAYDDALHAFDESLERLGLEYVDLYLVHWPYPTDSHLNEAWQALQDIYKSGRAKAIGVSNYTVQHLTELLEWADVKPMVNQIEFHPFIYAEHKDILHFCTTKGIAVQAYRPLARQFQTNMPQIQEIARMAGKTPAQVILRWCLQHGTVPLPRSANPEHMRENLDIYDFELDATMMAVLDGISYH